MYLVWRLLLSICFCWSAYAQSEVGGATLTGTVLDPQGASVSGAKVTVNNPANGLTRTVATNESGLFNFLRLPVGRYDLSVELQGFKTFRRDGIQLAVGAVAAIDARLEVGAISESVTVSSETPVVETTRSQTSTVINERSVRDLPINGRNFLDFTVLTPGVVRDPRGGDLSFGGLRGTSNSLMIDGGDSNNLFFGQSSGRAGTRNPYTFSQDAVGEFQVNTNSYAAEIGRAAGGVVNVITKSGTNDFHGGGFWFFRDRYLNANTFFNNSRGIVRQPYHFNQYGGNLGGPIQKNKLFFFMNYDSQRNTLPNAVFFPLAVPNDALSQQAAATLAPFLTPYVVGSDNDIGTAKVDWNISSTQTFYVRYNVHRFRGKNFENGGAQSAAEHTGNSNVSSDNLAVSYNKLIGSNKVWDSRFVFLKDDQPGQANSAAPEAIIRQAGRQMIAIGRNNFSPRYTNSKKTQIIQSLSWNRGNHAFKFGGDFNAERIDNFFPGNFSGAYTFDTLADFAARRPALFTQGFSGGGTGPLTQPNATEFAFFAQDSWRVTQKLTLNYGARYDGFRYASGTIKNPNAGLAAMNLDTTKIDNQKLTMGGRFGFAYKPVKGDWLVIRGGIGNYFARIPSILTGTSISQNGIQVQTYSLNAANPAQAPLFPVYPAILSAPPALARTPDIYVFEPNFQQPHSYQWNVNVEMRAARDVAVTVGYLGVRGMNLTRSRDINLFPEEQFASRLADGTPVSFGRRPLTRPNTSFGRITIYDSGASSIYHGMFLQVQKRYSRNFQVQSSYTFSKVIDTAPDATSVVVGTDDAKNARDTLNPNAERGVGNADVKHRFVVSAVWDTNYYRGSNRPVKLLINGWQLSLIGQAQSGLPYSATSNVDLNRDGNSRSDRSPGYGRNTLRNFGIGTLDVRLSKEIPLASERLKLRMIGEAFNSLNRANFTSPNATPLSYNATTNVFTPLTNFQQATNTGDPRILQLALRLSF